jgi:hypothetical protein
VGETRAGESRRARTEKQRALNERGGSAPQDLWPCHRVCTVWGPSTRAAPASFAPLHAKQTGSVSQERRRNESAEVREPNRSQSRAASKQRPTRMQRHSVPADSARSASEQRCTPTRGRRAQHTKPCTVQRQPVEPRPVLAHKGLELAHHAGPVRLHSTPMSRITTTDNNQHR